MNMQGQIKYTDLPPVLPGALTLASSSKTEAAGTASWVGRVEMEGAIPACITPVTYNMFLQWQHQQRGEEGHSRATRRY